MPLDGPEPLEHTKRQRAPRLLRRGLRGSGPRTLGLLAGLGLGALVALPAQAEMVVKPVTQPLATRLSKGSGTAVASSARRSSGSSKGGSASAGLQSNAGSTAATGDAADPKDPPTCELNMLQMRQAASGQPVRVQQGACLMQFNRL